jgi:transcriptional regulator with XRE-family HTH domain
MKIDTKLRQLRVKRGFSQEYLADRLGDVPVKLLQIRK